MKDVDIDCYADNNTPYIEGGKLDRVISALQNADASLFEWLSYNQMKEQILINVTYSLRKAIKRKLTLKGLLGGQFDAPVVFPKM